MSLKLREPLVIALFGDYPDEDSRETQAQIQAYHIIENLSCDPIILQGDDIRELNSKVSDRMETLHFLEEDDELYVVLYLSGRTLLWRDNVLFLPNSDDAVHIVNLVSSLAPLPVIILLDTPSPPIAFWNHMESQDEFVLIARQSLVPCKHMVNQPIVIRAWSQQAPHGNLIDHVNSICFQIEIASSMTSHAIVEWNCGDAYEFV